MHWINRLFMRAKVYQRVLWWGGGKKCYQVLRKILDKHVSLLFFNINDGPAHFLPGTILMAIYISLVRFYGRAMGV